MDSVRMKKENKRVFEIAAGAALAFLGLAVLAIFLIELFASQEISWVLPLLFSSGALFLASGYVLFKRSAESVFSELSHTLGHGLLQEKLLKVFLLTVSAWAFLTSLLFFLLPRYGLLSVISAFFLIVLSAFLLRSWITREMAVAGELKLLQEGLKSRIRMPDYLLERWLARCLLAAAFVKLLAIEAVAYAFKISISTRVSARAGEAGGLTKFVWNACDFVSAYPAVFLLLILALIFIEIKSEKEKPKAVLYALVIISAVVFEAAVLAAGLPPCPE